MLEVRKRNGFSDRNNLNNMNTEIQIYDFDEITRISLYNSFVKLYEELVDYGDGGKRKLYLFIMREVYVQITEPLSVYDYEKMLEDIKETILKDSYHAVLTLIESIAQYLEDDYAEYRGENLQETDVYSYYNRVFHDQYAGYRFVGEIITPISDEIEVETIRVALKNSFNGARIHLQKATEKISNRENPDYENSIKESITAVEAMCEIITGLRGKEATLGAMLKKLEGNGVVIHSALKAAFDKLYGYTNDANGIRHAGDIGGPNSTFEEAKFMLVSCSAFINYLIGVQAQQ